MKKQTGIWIDSKKAIVVTISKGEEVIFEIESDLENSIYHENEGDKGTFMGGQHVNNEGKFDERKKNQTGAYVKKVVDQVKQDDEIYIFGPAEMKLELKKEFEGNKQLASKLIGVETADSMTMNQVVAKVKSFYATN